MPDTRPVPFMEMKIAHSSGLKSKRVMTNYDKSWIDSFDPRPSKQRNDLPYEDQLEFARKLQEIDERSGILDYLLLGTVQSNSEPNSCELNGSLESSFGKDISNLTIIAKAKEFACDNVVNGENISNMSKMFVDNLKVAPEEIDTVNMATIGQHTNDNWHEMRHLLVTGKKIESLYKAKNY